MKEKQLDFANLFEELPSQAQEISKESVRDSSPVRAEKPGVLQALRELRRMMRPRRAKPVRPFRS